MPIGPLVPGTLTTVTPDVSPVPYTELVGPAPDGPVVADDVLAVAQALLNVQKVAAATKKIKQVVVDSRNRVTAVFTSSTLTPVRDIDATALDMVVTGCAIGDWLDINIGPLKVSVAASTGTYASGLVNIKVTSSAGDKIYSYAFDALAGAPVRFYPLQANIILQCAVTGSYSVTMQALVVGDGACVMNIDSPMTDHLAAHTGWPQTSTAEPQNWGRILAIGPT